VHIQNVAGDELINYHTSIRPTRNRLLTATAFSTCFVTLLLASLGLFVDFELNISQPGFERGDALIVHIRKDNPKKNSELTAFEKSARSFPREQEAADVIAEVQRELPSVDTPEPAIESQPEKDWHAIAKEVAKASIARNIRQEESRASMWRQSRSNMFQPADDIQMLDEEPLLSNIRFIQRSRVFGLGFNFGSCFFGIPIAGVPVEDRSIGPTIFVCTRRS
jgi:hypothetical protein